MSENYIWDIDEDAIEYVTNDPNESYITNRGPLRNIDMYDGRPQYTNIINLLKEQITIDNYIPVCVNLMYVIENLINRDRVDMKINACVRVLNEIRQLRPICFMHRKTITNLYKLAHNRKIEYFNGSSSYNCLCFYI